MSVDEDDHSRQKKQYKPWYSDRSCAKENIGIPM